MQNEIKTMTKLLDKNGSINNPGYATQMLYDYNRDNIKANSFRIKEWDFYQIIMGDYVLKMTIGNISYVAELSAELFNVVTKEKLSFSRMKILPFGSIKMPLNPDKPSEICVTGKDFTISFIVEKAKRLLKLTATDKNIGSITVDIELNNDINNEKMVIATPFDKEKCFYLNCKENYFGGKGTITFGDRTVSVDENSTAVLDWGRGVWPFAQEWFWGNGAAYIDGNKFGFNIGWGFGDLDSATENMLFWNGKAIKLGKLDVEVDTNDYMKPWKFKDEDNKFNMEMTPVYDKIADTKVGFIQMYCHQLFGYYNGFIVLPDGEKVVIRNMLAFCEHANNRW